MFGIIFDMKILTQNNWIKSLAVNAAILIAVLLTTNLLYETNDDYAIATRIADGYPYIGFINYYLCRVLIPLQQIFTGFNVFVVFQIAAAFAAFVFILKVTLDAGKNRAGAVMAALVILVFSVDHYCAVQFTKTAALLLVTGMLLLIDSMIKKRKWYYYLYAMIFLYLGVAFRADSFIAVIGFGGIFLIFWVFRNRRELKNGGYLTGRQILIYIILLGLIGGCYGFDMASERVNVSTDELSEYKEYSELRSDVVDYPVYEYYSGNEEAYDAIGISENDLYLIDHWYLDYDGAAGKKNLQAILQVDSEVHKEDKSISASAKTFVKHVISSVKKLSFTGVHVLLLIVLAIWAAVMVKPKYRLYIIALGAFTVCLYLALFYMYMGRIAYRAMYVADLGAAVWLLYFVNGQAETYVKRFCGRFKTAVCILAVAVMLLLIIPVWRDCIKEYDSISRRIMPERMGAFISEQDDSLFVFPVSEKKSSADYASPATVPGKYGMQNVMGTGSWGTMSPYILDKLAEYNMTNPIKGLIDNPKAYYVGNKDIDRVTEYYKKWYGSTKKEITLNRVDNIDGYSIWKVETQDKQYKPNILNIL